MASMKVLNPSTSPSSPWVRILSRMDRYFSCTSLCDPPEEVRLFSYCLKP